MSLTNEDLLTISNLMDIKMKPIKEEMKMIRVNLLVNNIIPRLSTIESFYLSTLDRNAANADIIKSQQADVEILKKVVAEHSEKLHKIP